MGIYMVIFSDDEK